MPNTKINQNPSSLLLNRDWFLCVAWIATQQLVVASSTVFIIKTMEHFARQEQRAAFISLAESWKKHVTLWRNLYTSCYEEHVDIEFVAKEIASLDVELTFRLGELPQEDCSIRISVNGEGVSEFPATNAWQRRKLSISEKLIQRGINRLTLLWPSAGLERGLNRRRPVWGDIQAIVVQKAKMSHADHEKIGCESAALTTR